MNRRIATGLAGTAALTLLWAGPAAADLTPTTETVCAEDQATVITRWFNPFGFDANVTMGGSDFQVPAYTSVVREVPYVANIPFAVTYAEHPGYIQRGTLNPAPLIDGCGQPSTTTTLAPPTSTVPPATPATTTVPPQTLEQPKPATPIIDQSVDVCGTEYQTAADDCDVPTLAFTGTSEDLAVVALTGGAFILSGGLMVYATRKRPEQNQ